MKLKDIFEVIQGSTKVCLNLKIAGVWLQYDKVFFSSFFQKFEKFYDFKVTKLDTDTLSFSHEGVLVIYAEES